MTVVHVPHLWEAVLVFVTAFVAAGLVYEARRLSRRLSGAHRDDLKAVQAVHAAPTTRLGGVAVMLGLVLGAWLTDEPFRSRIMLLWVCAIPVLAAGLLEDLGVHVRPIVRLAAAAAASALAIVLLERWLPRLDIPYVDAAMRFYGVAVLLTIIAGAALSHAFNLIDGLNGLCLGVAFCACAGMSAIAHAAGDVVLADALTLMAIGVLGVLPWNFPRGRIFLGDTGAYLLGFGVCWLAIAVVWRNESVSAWALLLTVLWPVMETSLTILRRLRARAPVFEPDNRHMHQMVLALLQRRWGGGQRPGGLNPMATLVLALLFMAPPIAGALLWDAPGDAFGAVVVFSVLYVVTYGLLSRDADRAARLARVEAGTTAEG